MEQEAIEVSRFLVDFKPLIYKTLKRLNIQPRHMDYEDCFQELQIHLLSIRKSYLKSGKLADAETERYKFTSYAGQGLYWHGLNLIKKNKKAAFQAIDSKDIEWLNHAQNNKPSTRSDIVLSDFFCQAKKMLTDEDYLLLLFLADEEYTIDKIAEEMQVSRSTIYQRKSRIQERLQDIKDCLTD